MYSNINIFDFKFVDREIERGKVDEFINSEDNVLWIDGTHGVGKSYFIEKHVIPAMQAHYKYVVYVNKSSSESRSYLEILVDNLSHSLPMPFENYIKKKYKMCKNIAKNISKTLVDINLLKTETVLLNLMLDLDNIFLSVENQNQGPSKVLDSYLEDVALNESAFIILDNFSYCDLESFYVMEEMLISMRDVKNIKFLICTTTEEREKNHELNVFICDKLAHIYIPIKQLDDVKYFKEIMSNKFIMTQDLFENINDIYELCMGIPDNLKNFVRQLYIENGIQISNNGYTIIEEKAIELIYNKSINFNPEALNASQILIVQILALFHRPMPYKMLEDFIAYMNNDYTQNNFIFKLVIDRVFTIVETLINSKILVIKIQNGIEILSFEHDNIFNALYNYYHQEKSSANVAYIHYLLFTFIQNQKFQISNYGLTESEFLWILAEQSYYALADKWEIYNKDLAQQLYKENKMFSCNQILSRFRKTCKDISKDLRLFMAEVFYEIAEYNACRQMLDALNMDKLTDNEKSMYYLLYGKAISFINSQKALDNFLNALKLNISFEQKCRFQYYCIMSYAETNAGLNKARFIFSEFYKNKKCRESKVYTSVLRAAVNLFDPPTSLNYLKEGLKIAQSRNDILEEAKIANNIGFTYTRLEKYDEAQKNFLLSYQKLENSKPFEMSYPITNLAFIFMVNEDWQNALDCIEMASIYNKTEFIPTVLKTYKMICFAKLNKLDCAEEISLELSELIKNHTITDYKMIKKCKMNCAYIAYKMGDVETKERLLQECWSLVKNTFAEERYINLCKKMESEPPVKPSIVPEGKFDLYNKIDFEPWVVTFGHD